MEVGQIAATMLQASAAFMFQFVLIPKKYTWKRSLMAIAVIIGAFTVLAACFIHRFGTPFMTQYGFLIIGVPFFVGLYFLSSARGLRFLFIVLTAMIFHQILYVILIAIRVYTGFSMTYFILNVILFGGLVWFAWRIRKEFQKIVFAYKDEFVWLSVMLVILFAISGLFMPVTEHNTIDPDLFLVSVMLYILSISIYLYIWISFKNLSRQYDAQRDALFLHHQIEEATNQILLLRSSQESAIGYRHDLRHHLSLLSELTVEGNLERIKEYLKHVQADLNRITPSRFCRNEMVNLIFASFEARAAPCGVRLSIDADLPENIPIPETELCTLLSNGLENAIAAAAGVTAHGQKEVRISCRPHKGNLLIFIENSFEGNVIIKDGLPESDREGHGYGTKSMAMIAKRHDGYCSFAAKEGVFTLKIVVPLMKDGLI